MDCSAVVFDISRNASGQFDLCKRSLEESFSFSAERNEIKTFIGEWRTKAVGMTAETCATLQISLQHAAVYCTLRSFFLSGILHLLFLLVCESNKYVIVRTPGL